MVGTLLLLELQLKEGVLVVLVREMVMQVAQVGAGEDILG